MRYKSTVLLIILFALISTTEATTRKVPQDYATIQLAINAAVNGDTVLVAEGTYVENILLTKKIVLGSLYVKDGDTTHISKTIIDGGIPSVPDSASVIRIFAGTDTTTVITGFTIRNGKGTKLDLAGSADWISGGGILLYAGGATITRNIITQNNLSSSLGVYGGGITVDPYLGPISYWVIEHNRITNNTITATTTNTGLTAEGAGVWLTGNGRLINNVISGNVATSIGTFSVGGGISLIGSSTVLISNNDVRENFANNGGGFWMGAASQTARPSVTLQNNLVIGNSGTSGAAMNILSGDFVLVNNTIADNVASHAIRLFAYRGNLTFRFLNNILWNPAADSQLTIGIGSTYVSYSCIKGGYAGSGITSADPLFAQSDPNYHLSNSSPCIGTGISSASVGGVTISAPLYDYFNTQRPRAAGTPPDMGAVENDLPISNVVKELSSTIPSEFSLSQNYPNPFNPTTTIRFAIPVAGFVSLKVFDLLGKEIATLVNEKQSAGWKEVQWNASRNSSGIYFLKMSAGNFSETKKIVLIK